MSRKKNERKMFAENWSLAYYSKFYSQFDNALKTFVKTGNVLVISGIIWDIYKHNIEYADAAWPYVIALRRDVDKFRETFCKLTGHK